MKYGLFVKKPQIRRIKDWGAANKNNNNSNNNNNNETGKESAIKASKPSPQKETLTTPSYQHLFYQLRHQIIHPMHLHLFAMYYTITPVWPTTIVITKNIYIHDGERRSR